LALPIPLVALLQVLTNRLAHWGISSLVWLYCDVTTRVIGFSRILGWIGAAPDWGLSQVFSTGGWLWGQDSLHSAFVAGVLSPTAAFFDSFCSPESFPPERRQQPIT